MFEKISNQVEVIKQSIKDFNEMSCRCRLRSSGSVGNSSYCGADKNKMETCDWIFCPLEKDQ